MLAVGLQFGLYVLVDQGAGPVEALKESWRLTDGYKITVFLVNTLFSVGVVAFSCVTLGLMPAIAAPVLALTQAVMYHSLVHIQGPAPRML